MAILLNHPIPEEGLHHQEPNTTAYIRNKEIGKGTLYITESVFCWISNNGEGFSLNYPSIYIHAVSKDVSHFPHPCLFLIVEGDLEYGEGAEETSLVKELNALSMSDENMDADSEEEEIELKSTEFKFVPENTNMLDIMFQAVSDCQALNPEPGELSDEDSEIFPDFPIENGVVEEEDWEEEDSDMNEDQFEDAED